MLKKPIRTTLPFYTKQENQYFRKAQCWRECYYGTITDKSHLPPFMIVRPKRVDDIVLSIQCLEGQVNQFINPLITFEVLRFVNSDEKATIESYPVNIGDNYYISEAGIIVNSWQSLVGKKVQWNGAIWVSSEIDTVATEGQFIEENQLNLVHVWSGTEWIKTLNGLQICTIGDFDYIVYNGYELSTNLACGIRQLKLTDSLETFYSDLIDVRLFDPEDNDYHKLIIENDCNLGNIPYEEFIGFRQYLYFEKDSLIGTPEYETEQETEKDGVGNELTLFQRQKKLQLMESLLVPEYIVDWLNFVILHDRIKVKLPNEKEEKLIDNYELTTEWISVGCYANCVIKFSDEEDITNTGCCVGVEKAACLLSKMTIINFVDINQKAGIEALPPQVDDAYIINTNIGGAVSGDWFDNLKNIAVWNGSGWDYIVPTPNECFYHVVGQVPFVGEDSNWFFVDSFGLFINQWLLVPGLFVSIVGVELFKITVAIPEGVFACIYARNEDTGVLSYLGSYSKEELEIGVIKQREGCIDWSFYAIAQTSNDCSYGKSNEVIANYQDCECLGNC